MDKLKVLTLVKELNEDFEILLKGFDCEIVKDHADDISVVIFDSDTSWDELSLRYLDKGIVYIALSPPRNLKEFFEQGGRVVLNQDLLGINVIRVMLQRLLGQSSSVRIEEAFGAYLENMNSLKLVDHVGLGSILDKIGLDAWDEDYNIVDVRLYVMAVCTYLCYLRQSEIARFPISIDYGRTEDVQIVQISASVENFFLEYIWEGFEYGHQRRIASKVLLGEALAHSDLMDIYYQERGRKIVITGVWINSNVDVRTGYGNLLVSHIDSFEMRERRWKGFKSHPEIDYESKSDDELLELREKPLPGDSPQLLRGEQTLGTRRGLLKRIVQFVIKVHGQSDNDKRISELDIEEIKSYIHEFPDKEVVKSLTEADYEIVSKFLRENPELEKASKKSQGLYDSIVNSLGRVSFNEMQDKLRVGGYEENLDEEITRVAGHEKSVYNEKGQKVSGAVTFDGEKFVIKGGGPALDENGNYWVPGNAEENQNFQEGEVVFLQGEQFENEDIPVEELIASGGAPQVLGKQSLVQKVAQANANRNPIKKPGEPTYRVKGVTDHFKEESFVIPGGPEAWDEKKAQVVRALQQRFENSPPQTSAEIEQGLSEALAETLDLPQEMTEGLSSGLVDDSLFDGMDIDIDDRINDVLEGMEDRTPPHLQARNEQMAKREKEQVDKMKTVMDRMKSKMVDMAGLQAEYSDVAKHLNLDDLDNLEDAKEMLNQVKAKLSKLPQDPNRFVTRNELEVKDKKIEFLEKMVANLKDQVVEEQKKTKDMAAETAKNTSGAVDESVEALEGELKSLGEQHERFKSEMEKQLGQKSEYIANLEEQLAEIKRENADKPEFEMKNKVLELEQLNRRLERQLEDAQQAAEVRKAAQGDMVSADKLQERERKVAHLKEENERLNELMKALDKEKNEAVKELETMETSVERLQEELMEERNKDSAEARSDQEGEIESLKADLKEQELKTTRLQTELDKANAKTKEEQINVKRLEQKLKLMHGQLAAQTKKTTRSTNKTMGGDSGASAANATQMKRLEALNKKLKDNHQKAVADLTEKKKQVIQLETEIRQLKQTISNLEKKSA